MQLFWLIYLFLISSTCFGRCLRPSSGALDCIYSIDVVHRYSGAWYHGWDGTAVPSHPWHQLAAISVDNIRCCKYSQVLLMMGEDIARNM